MEPSELRQPPDAASAEDATILAEIARGDLGRFEVLVDRYKFRLMSYLRHRVSDRHQVEDLVQETFLRLFRAARKAGYSGQAIRGRHAFPLGSSRLPTIVRPTICGPAVGVR